MSTAPGRSQASSHRSPQGEGTPVSTTVTYLFDPLCGWCYGASPVVQKLGQHSAITLELALTAVALTEPSRELETLKVLQEARYVQGLDTCDATVVGQLLRDQGLADAAHRLAAADAELRAANAARLRQAQGLMQSFGVQGVPALVVTDDNGRRLLRGNALYGDFEQLLSEIAGA